MENSEYASMEGTERCGGEVKLQRGKEAILGKFVTLINLGVFITGYQVFQVPGKAGTCFGTEKTGL